MLLYLFFLKFYAGVDSEEREEKNEENKMNFKPNMHVHDRKKEKNKKESLKNERVEEKRKKELEESENKGLGDVVKGTQAGVPTVDLFSERPKK